jgi:hypothetical protein
MLGLQTVVASMIGSGSAMMISNHNADISNSRYFLEKRAVVADNIASESSAYIENWRKLISISGELNKKVSDNQPVDQKDADRFATAVLDRDKARIKFFSCLDTARLYYSENISSLIDRYQDWDSRQAKLEEINVSGWYNERNIILKNLHNEISDAE